MDENSDKKSGIAMVNDSDGDTMTLAVDNIHVIQDGNTFIYVPVAPVKCGLAIVSSSLHTLVKAVY